jgi:hypothetical protein
MSAAAARGLPRGSTATSRASSRSTVPATRAIWPLTRGITATRRAAASPDAAPSSTPVSLPTTPEAQVALAADAVVAAWREGWTRQSVQLELPLIGASDLDDWPGGIRQQFKAARPLVEELLRRVRSADPLVLGGALAAEIWDDGDAVGAWVGSRAPLACVLFPTAQTLDRARALAESQEARGQGQQEDGSARRPLTLIVNPQFQPDLSDYGGPFGFGRDKALAAARSFRPSFAFTRRRVFGDDVYTLRAHPAPWRVAVVVDTRAGPGAGGGGARLLLEAPADALAPSYSEIEAALRARPDSAVNMPIGERLRRELAWNNRSLQEGPPPPQ